MREQCQVFGLMPDLLGGIVGEGWVSARLKGLGKISQPSSFPHSPLPSGHTALIRLIRIQCDDKRAFAFYGHRYFQASTLSSNNAGAWINTAHLSVASGLSPAVNVFQSSDRSRSCIMRQLSDTFQ